MEATRRSARMFATLGSLSSATLINGGSSSLYGASVTIPHPHDGLFVSFSSIPEDDLHRLPQCFQRDFAVGHAWLGILSTVFKSFHSSQFISIHLNSSPLAAKTARDGTAKRGVAFVRCDLVCCSVA